MPATSAQELGGGVRLAPEPGALLGLRAAPDAGDNERVRSGQARPKCSVAKPPKPSHYLGMTST